MKRPFRWLAALGLVLASTALVAAERGRFGFSVSVDADGIFDPVLKSATVAKVEDPSPASKAGLRPGDQIVQIEGREVSGSKAKAMQALMQRDVGQVLVLVVKRPGGELTSLSLTAAGKSPAEPARP